MKKILAIATLLLSLQGLSAQPYTLQISGDADLLKKEKISIPKNFRSEKDIRQTLQEALSKLFSSGYLESSFDTLYHDSTHYYTRLHGGSVYEWGKLSRGNIDEEALSQTGFREKVWQQRKMNRRDIGKLTDALLGYYENHGYPFATVKIDSITIEKNIFNGVLQVRKGKFYKIDSILVKGDAVISRAYLYNYIGIRQGDVYNENALRKIDLRIKEIPFVSSTKSSEVVFSDNQANLYLYISKKKASQFNGILGILPNATTGKIVITGDAQIGLKNIFGKGEGINLNWRKLNTDIQDLKANFNYPFLFKTNFGTDLNFKLYKRDSTFLELQKNAAIQYLLKAGSYFKVFFANNTSDLLTPSMFANATSLPSFADVTTTLYGIGFHLEKLDYKFNPRSGFLLHAEGSAGTKKIRKNPKLDESLYENITLKTNQYQLTFNGEGYLPLFKRSTLKIANNSGYIYNQNLFLNELFRIGGLKTLRGFYEESIPASFYTIGTLEYRFLLEQNSALYAFLDYGYYERKTRDDYHHDTPYGVGGGIYFSSGPGIFSIGYSVGSQEGLPLQLKASRIHFGFLSFF